MSTQAVVETYLVALSSGDVDGAVSCVANDFANEHTSSLGSSSVGRETYRERLPAFLAQFSALQYEVISLISDGDRAAIRYRLTANCSGDPIDIPGVMLFELEHDLITRRTDFWDSLTFLRQTGAVEEHR
jgi:ketosteroid isomerase-like protein